MADPRIPSVFPRPFRGLVQPLGTSARGMSVQQRFLETIAGNLANAHTTRTPEGGPYRRQVAVDEGGEVRTVEDPRPGRQSYDPGHPDADANGFVTEPNVNVESELVDLMVVRRLFEANASVFQAAKTMLRRALEI